MLAPIFGLKEVGFQTLKVGVRDELRVAEALVVAAVVEKPTEIEEQLLGGLLIQDR